VNPSFGWTESLWSNSPEFQILGMPENGTFAEKVCVPVSQIVAKPSHLDFRHAAALPLAGLTAYRALFTRAGLKSGENVLISGIGGGVALFAFLFARAAGANVYVTSGSEEKISRAKSLGAVSGFNYKTPEWDKAVKAMFKAKGIHGFDVSIDSAGGPGFATLIELASPGGRIAVYGATAGDPPTLPQRRIFWKQLSILGSTMGSPTDFEDMLRFVEKHRLQPPVSDHVFTLSEGNAAFAAMHAAEQFGKIVLEIGAA
jgi:NADPH:quinone reductase-like Zn-dependent oxidoreductase